MADPYTEYLNAVNQGTTATDPYTDYLNIVNQGTPQPGDPYQDYLDLLTQQSQSITPNQEEIDELKPTHPVGFGGALWEGFKSGMTLGYVADEPIEDMTYGEMSGMLIGEMAGGLIPLGLATTATGGFGAPVVAGARMKRAYKIIDEMRKVGKKLDKAKKLDNKAKITKHELTRNKLRKELVGFKEEYMREMAAKGLGTRGLKQLAKTPVMPQAAGYLGRREWYQKSIKKVAEHFGPAGANALNRFASTSAAFALTGLARKRGEGPFGELEMADRLSGIPKDMWMGGLFTVAGLPSMLGVKGAGLIEPAALMGVGAYSDYLTGEPSEMSPEERLMHGMTLIGFHYIQQGLSNIGVKEKVYNALREMNFSESQALAISHNNKAFDAQIKAIRNGETFRYRNKKDKDDWTVVNMEGKREDGTAFIDLQNVQTLEKKTYTGKTLTEARENLHKEYDRFDYKDPKLKDDVYRRDDMDFQNRMRDDIIGENIEKIPTELKQKQNDLQHQSKIIDDAIKKPRTFEIKEKSSKEVSKKKKAVIDIRKDFKLRNDWFAKELEWLNKKFKEDPELTSFKYGNVPDRYKWISSGDRKFLSRFIDSHKIGGTYEGVKLTPERLQKRIHEVHRKESLKDPSKALEKDFPVQSNDYKVGDVIVIPKINRHRSVADEGTGKAFDYNESQLAKIVKKDLDIKDADRYVPAPDKSTIKVETVDLASGETIQVNIRMGKGPDVFTQAENIVSNFMNQIADKDVVKKHNMKGQRKNWVVFQNWKDKLEKQERKEKGLDYQPEFDQSAMQEKWLQSIGALNKEQLISKLKDYKEPDVFSNEFLSSKAKINKEVYNTKMFQDASTLAEGKHSKTFYEPELYTIDSKGNKELFPIENIGYKGEYVFDDYLEAFRKMEKIWSEPGANKFLKGLKDNYKRQIDNVSVNKDWQRFNNKKQQIKKSFKEQGLSNWEQVAFVSTLYPQSKTKSIGATLDKLTQSEINRVERFINKKESQPVYDSNIVSLMPDDMSSKASLIGNRMWNAVREYTLATAAYFEPLGDTGKRISRKLEQFSMWRANTMGTVVNFEKGMNAKLKEYGLNLTEVNEHIQIMRDPKYETLRDSRKYKKFLEKIEGVEVAPATKVTPAVSLKDYIIKSYDNFFDSMASVLISSNSWVKTTTKDGKVESRRFINLYDKNGNAIELVDMYKNPNTHFDQVSSFLSFAKGESKKVVNSEGKTVVVDAKKSKHFYEATYSPRILSDRFLEISDIANRDSKKAIRDLMESEMIKDIPVSSARKEEIARQMLNEIINMQDASGVYGQQWSRIAELPSHYYLKQREGRLKFDKDNMEIIQVDNVVKANGELYKKGDKIVDKAGREHIIEEVVPVYERDYNKVMKRYSDGISHSTAAAHTYGSPHHGKILWKHLADKLSKEMDDTYYGAFAEKVIKNQLFGETRTRFDMIARPAARIGALTGLSSPMSPLKNILLGNVQNATVFTAKEMLQTMRHLSSGKTWKSAKEMSQFEGHTHIGSYDLFLAKEPFKGAHWLRKIAENAAVGGMRVTESFNRIFSATLGEFSLRNTVDNLAGVKNPANKRVPTYDSRRMMLDVFKFTPEEISSLIARRKRALELNEPMEYKATEMQRARYRAQLVTQGSGDIAYVPYWMGKQWAKPLTLFYRVAFRMTDTAANNVIKPIITDGNMIPAMKYVSGSVASGYAIYNMYDWILDEERVNKFKSMPNNMLQYFIKAEGLGIFSNLFGEYGGGIDSYEAVIVRNAKSFADMLVGFTKEAVRGEPEFAIKEVKDGVSEIVAGYNFYKGIWDRATGETRKLVKDSRRRQTQFLDAFYPKEKLDIDYDDGTTSKTAYYRAIRDNFWIDDSKRRAQSYYAALHYLTHTIMAEQGYTKRAAKKEARNRLKRVMTRMRPIPTSWRKKPGRTKKSKYHEYYTRLPKGAQEQEDALDSLYIQKKQELYNAIRQYKNLYDTENY